MNFWVVHYSRTGTSARLADLASDTLVNAGHQVSRSAIVARPELPYPLWLALSFIPRLPCPVTVKPPTVAPLHGCVLVSPKWTFNCPPVGGFLRHWASRLPTTALIVSCGGWDQERYLRALESRMRKMGVPVHPGAWVRMREMAGSAARERVEGLIRNWPGSTDPTTTE
jgi:hypothetical protein